MKMYVKVCINIFKMFKILLEMATKWPYTLFFSLLFNKKNYLFFPLKKKKLYIVYYYYPKTKTTLLTHFI